MSKFVKKAIKGAKKIVKGVTKIVKKIVKSKIFKIVLIAAAIYLGGAALGAWQSPFASVNGAWTAAGSQAAQQSALQGGIGSGSLVGSAGADGVVATAPATAGGGANAVSGISKAAAAAREASMESIISKAAAEKAGGGILSKVAGGVLKAGKTALATANANPLATAIVANAVSGAFTPDRLDEMDHAAELMERNKNVGGVNIGISPIWRNVQAAAAKNNQFADTAVRPATPTVDYAAKVREQLALQQPAVDRPQVV